MNSKTFMVAMASALAAVWMAGGSHSAAATAPSTTCTFRPVQGVVWVSVTGVEVGVDLVKAPDGNLLVDADLCLSPKGKVATMPTIDTVVVRGGVGDQSVTIDLSGGPFAPGRTDERGPSDEIEFDLALGTGLDTLRLRSDSTAFNVHAGTRGGVHRLNLAAGEVKGVDADVTARGVESILVSGSPLGDRFVASGGRGTGRQLAVRVFVEDLLGGNDLFVGGRAGDDISDAGVAPDSDTLRGGPGADRIFSYDPDVVGDLVDAGRGTDFCSPNPEDTVLRCEQLASS